LRSSPARRAGGDAKRLAGLDAKIAIADLDVRSYREFDAEAKT